jgi:branched-chain amino acid transport system permease protein
MIVASRTGQSLLGAAALAIASMPFWASPWHMQLASTALVAALFALSLQVLAGATGLVSLAQAGFFGLGAYTIYLLGSPPIWITLPAAMAVAGVAALLIGPLALRTKGFFFLMSTLAFGQMLFFVFHDTPLGGGTDGQFIQRPAIGFLVSRSARPMVMLLLNLGVLTVVYASLCALMRTALGHALQGIRSNENRMAALGHDVQRLKLIAFVLAGALGGLAGHMSTLTDGFVSPDLLGWHRSAEALLMILLGGIGALHGPILGAFALTAIQEAGSLITDRPKLIEGVVFLLAVVFLRQGLAGLWTRRGPGTPIPRPVMGAESNRDRGGKPAILRAESVSRRFGGLLAVDQVSLTLEQGILHAVIGPNGAGKSTLVNLLSGEIPLTSGRVSLDGRDISADPAWKRGSLGIGRTFQRTNVMRDMTVLENARLAAQARASIGLLRSAATDDLVQTAWIALDRSGLSAMADATAGMLSHGQARLLEIAMAQAGNPSVLLLDEPLAGLGPEESLPVAALLRDLAKDHAVLLIEHDMDVVFAVADIVTVMVNGRVLARGTPAEIRGSADVRDAYLGHGI